VQSMDFEFDDLFQDGENKELKKTEDEDTENVQAEGELALESSEEGDLGQTRIPMHKKGFDDFRSLRTIGEGAYGKVYQVQDKVTRKIYAMKVLKKSHLLKKKAISCTMTERDILTKVRHPLIIKLYCTFQTAERVGFVMEYINGGQLFYHMRKESLFTEDLARFYAAEIIVALEHLHKSNIIHRDLKPENILITSQGHICLTDFGLAKEEVESDEGASTFCGTLEYMSPEMIKGVKYGKPADFWSVGILIYDMLWGQPPFHSKNRKKLQDQILNKKINMPSYWQKETQAFIRAITNRDPKKRLKIDQIKGHPYFKGFRWAKFGRLEIEPPFKPNIEKGDMDVSNIDEYYISKDPTFSPANAITQSQDDQFRNFTYVRSYNTPTSSLTTSGTVDHLSPNLIH